jgi:transcriptional regulator with XRE-family HTH domain
MLTLLHNVQMPRKGNFAYHAVAHVCTPCKAVDMRVRLRDFRDRMGLSQEDMAARTGYSVSQISRWEAGVSNIPSERLPVLAEAYECRIADIFDEDDSPFEALGPTLYVKGIAQAGQWAEVWQDPPSEWKHFPGRSDVTALLRDRFGIRVKGDSMNEVYPDGTIVECVAFHGGVEIENGRRVVVQRRRNGTEFEVTIKEYYRDADGIEWLVPRSTNPAFQSPIRADQQEPNIDEVQIIGIVVGSYRPE